MIDEASRPVGRPTDYRPEHCAKVIEWGKQGKSKAWMCAELDIARTTLDLWIETHKAFSYAMDVALHKSQQWWEDAGQSGIHQQGFGAAVWSRSMAARFPKEWREKGGQGIAIEGNGKIAITISPVENDF